MGEAIAVLNAGSSSLKFSLFEVAEAGPALLARRQVEGRFDGPAAARRLLAFVAGQGAGRRLVAVGHRVVHGGIAYSQPVRIDAGVLDALERLVPLAPLHQPHNLAPIRALADAEPGLPQVACFDTAFHRTQPRVASTFALPDALTQAGVQRYGFHGLSYEYIASALYGVDPNAAQGKVIVAHLGNGASMCALDGGRSVATTMGMTALDGLVMGTRAGLLDPGVVLHLLNARGMDAPQIERLLYHESGLLGVSGISSDMRTLLASSDPRAQFAVEIFCYRVVREIGSLAAALGGLDALVFTGGIGEHAAPVRARVVEQMGWLRLALDPAANARHAMRITKPDSAVPSYVIPTDEELVIARHTRATVAG